MNVTVKRYLPFLPLGPMQLDLFGGGAAATMSSTAAADAAQLESGSKTYIEVSPPPGSLARASKPCKRFAHEIGSVGKSKSLPFRGARMPASAVTAMPLLGTDDRMESPPSPSLPLGHPTSHARQNGARPGNKALQPFSHS